MRVRQHLSVGAEIERELIRRFDIKHALVSLDYTDADVQRSGVASLVANHLSKTQHERESRLAVNSSVTARRSKRRLWCKTQSCEARC